MNCKITIRTSGISKRKPQITCSNWLEQLIKVQYKGESCNVYFGDNFVAKVNSKRAFFIEEGSSVSKDMYNIEINTENYGNIGLFMALDESHSKTLIFDIKLNQELIGKLIHEGAWLPWNVKLSVEYFKEVDHVLMASIPVYMWDLFATPQFDTI
ncbi:hypothetical protein [Colwellia sp. MEBiC06753]